MQETFYSITTEKPIPPFTVALIADLHGAPSRPVLESLRAQRPDLIAIAGDLRIGEPAPYPTDFLSHCAALSPVYYSLGNHEKTMTEEVKAALSSLGITVLDNAWVRSSDLIIGGMTSPYVLRWRQTGRDTRRHMPPETGWLKEFERQEGFKLLLDHHPEHYPEITRNRNIDLILSGHAHGGQIRINGKGLFAPQQGFFPEYTGGVYDNRLVVSRGLSNTTLIPRWGNPPELVYISVISNEVIK